MLNKSKRTKLQTALRSHLRKNLNPKRNAALGEADTRQIIDDMLCAVLGYTLIDEVVSEFAVKGLKADYVVQLKDKPKFLIEAKSFAKDLKVQHLNQAAQYASLEGLDWILVSNGRHYDLYKVIWGKPMQSRKVFSVDLSDPKRLQESIDCLQYLHKFSVSQKGLDLLWRKTIALDPANVAGLLYAPTVLNYLKRTLKSKHKRKFSDGELVLALDKVIGEKVNLDEVNPVKVKKAKAPSSTTGLAKGVASNATSSGIIPAA